MSARDWINPDDFLLTPAGRVWTPERNEAAWEQAYASLRQALSRKPHDNVAGQKRDLYLVCGIQGSGKSTWIRNNAPQLAPCVFFDAALPKASHRLPILAMAHSVGAPAHAVWIDTPLEVCLRRNAERQIDERVPEAAIRSVATQFEPPSPAEGFIEVLHVEGIAPC
jgi:AAA domain